VLVVDAYYRSRSDGTLIFRSPALKRNLLWFDIQTESVALYEYGINLLIQSGWRVIGITVDGRKGVIQALSKVAPVQYCQFHQKKTIRKHLTKHPQHSAAQELKAIADRLTYTDQPSMAGWLAQWRQRWDGVLKERTYHPSGKWSYTHRRLRAAYFSLIHNLPWLFTYHLHPELPNTTNSLDGSIRHLRTLHRVHQGIQLQNRRKLTDELLRGKYPKY